MPFVAASLPFWPLEETLAALKYHGQPYPHTDPRPALPVRKCLLSPWPLWGVLAWCTPSSCSAFYFLPAAICEEWLSLLNFDHTILG